METFKWICVVLSAFTIGIFTGYFTIHLIEDWIDFEREWKAIDSTKSNKNKKST